jgi:hypothetical protein
VSLAAFFRGTQDMPQMDKDVKMTNMFKMNMPAEASAER